MPARPSRIASTLAMMLFLGVAGAQGQTFREAPREVKKAEPVVRAEAPEAEPAPRTSAVVAVDPGRRIIPGDEIQYEIVEDKEGLIDKVVTAAGTLHIVPLGFVKVAGKTAAQAAKDIEAALTVDYYFKASVNLAVARPAEAGERGSIGNVEIIGKVKQEGVYPIAPGDGVNRAILKAGNLNQFADPKKIRLFRKGSSTPEMINLKDIREGKAPDPKLKDGDRIDVGRAFFIFQGVN